MKLISHSCSLVAIVLLLFLPMAQAKDLAQGRLFFGPTYTSPSDFNTELENQGLKNISLINNFGVEITFPSLEKLNLGMRYTKKIFDGEEDPETSATNFSYKGSQDAILLLARYFFIKTESFHTDVVLGGGLTNTTIDINSATQAGELKKTASDDFFANPCAAAGISIGAGFKRIYFTIEAGYEFNKIDDFKTSGTLSANYSDADLSGTYVLIGITLDKIPTFTK